MAQPTKSAPGVVVFPGPAGGPARLGRDRLRALLGRRLPALRLICGITMGCAALAALGSVVSVRYMSMPLSPSPRGSLAATGGAVLLLVASSVISTVVPSRAGRGAPPPPTAEAAEALAAAILDAYARATGLSSTLLTAAACLGLVVAVVTGNARYALVICLAAVASMAVRWPRRAVVEALLARRGLR